MMEFSGEQLEKDLKQILDEKKNFVNLMIVNQRFYARDFKNLMKEMKLKRIDHSKPKEIISNPFIDDVYRLVAPDDLEKDELLIYARVLDDKRNLWLSTFSFGSDGFIEDTGNYARRMFYKQLFKVDPDFLAELPEETQARIKASYKENK